jgi:hypothetical protein
MVSMQLTPCVRESAGRGCSDVRHRLVDLGCRLRGAERGHGRRAGRTLTRRVLVEVHVGLLWLCRNLRMLPCNFDSNAGLVFVQGSLWTTSNTVEDFTLEHLLFIVVVTP